MPPTDKQVRRTAMAMLRFERQVLAGSLWVSVPPLLLSTWVLLAWPMWSNYLSACIWLAVIACCVGLARWQRRRITYPVYTLISLLEALREGDYSLRGRAGGPFVDVVYNVNELAERLQHERLAFEEASYLLSKTLAALASAVFVFDATCKLQLVNPAGERLFDRRRERLFGESAESLGMQAWLEAPAQRVISHAFPGRSGRFEVRYARLRSSGRDSKLLVINDLGQILREEERLAWQRLLRVLGHEVNNSLAPISSMAATLAQVAAREQLPEDWREDFQNGLQIIGARASSLSRFLASYGRLARLPPPQLQRVSLQELIEQLTRLERRVSIRLDVESIPEICADPDQLSQALINLLNNAVEANPSGDARITIRWHEQDGFVYIVIDDQGPGPPPSDNLFVPFFTTKPGGSGIGLALVRQIAEAHGGGVSLVARDAGGARASLWLPHLANNMTLS
jgi:two-component system, NtrC family, nitrogen regulation sensor histidine kinase NtrY